MMRGDRRLAMALLGLVWLMPGLVPVAYSLQPDQVNGTGRGLVTVTTLDGAVHLAGVQVELRTPNHTLVLARTLTNGVVSYGNVIPRFRKLFTRVRAFEPRLSLRGPIKRDRLFVAQDMQFRYVATPVKSLPDDPTIDLRSFDSFTRVDGVVSARHTLGGGLILFPRKVQHATMNTFRPAETTPDFVQSGWSAGALDRRRSFRMWCSKARSPSGSSRSKCMGSARRPWSMRRTRRAAGSSTTRSATSRACSGSRRSA
jgi:hypothetical protein